MRVLVTGGSGFVGAAVVSRFLARGDAVRVLQRRPAGRSTAAEPVLGDVRLPEDVQRAVDGCDVVVHCAARAGHWGPATEFHDTNVNGTENVIEACRRRGVGRLVFTSSPSVVHGGSDLCGVDESAPYASTFAAPYPRTKAIAERMVLAANGAPLAGGGRLATVALRPHLVWGPGDPHFLPRLVERARRGRLFQIGHGRWLVDTVYVDNAADAHVLAADALTRDAAVGGRCYFITQDDPRPVADVLAQWLDAAGIAAAPRRLPVPAARALAWGAEAAHRLRGPGTEPPLTRFLVQHLTTAHWFDIGAAKRDLGYRPRISTAAGLELLRAHLARG